MARCNSMLCLLVSVFTLGSSMTCPGSGAFLGHAKTEVIATAATTCANVKSEILSRAGGQNGWVDPHNGGVYSVLSSTDTEIRTQRTTNPKYSVMGKVFTDKQVFSLTESGNSCVISACSESQGTSMKDFSTNYCDVRNLYCGSADGCHPVSQDFASRQDSVDASSGQSDWSACVVKHASTDVKLAPQRVLSTDVSGMTCPGSGAWFGHAKTEVTATAATTCANVKSEILSRAGGQNGWVDPHNGGVYSVLSSTDTEIRTQRTTNPQYSVMGKVFTDKQVFTLTESGDSCVISACSESQSSSLKDFSTNYCDVRNLYCGSADGCHPVSQDFASQQVSVASSSGQSDWSVCIVKHVDINV